MIQRFITNWKNRKIEKQAKNDDELKPQNPKRRLAEAGEIYTRSYLRSLGWTITEQNWRAGRHAEIDIIAKDKAGTLVFVEVKARRTNGFESGFTNIGFESINLRKQRKIMTCAYQYLAKHKLVEQKYRFDAVVLYYPATMGMVKKGQLPGPIVNHVANIF